VSKPSAPTVRVESCGRGVFLIHDGDTQRLAYAVVDRHDTWVWYEGRVHLVPHEEVRVSRRTDDMALAAPMPATVRAVRVSEGQRVSSGDVLVVLEAMKMEIAIKASTDGRVRALHCAPGDLVQPGVPLVEIDA